MRKLTHEELYDEGYAPLLDQALHKRSHVGSIATRVSAEEKESKRTQEIFRKWVIEDQRIWEDNRRSLAQYDTKRGLSTMWGCVAIFALVCWLVSMVYAISNYG